MARANWANFVRLYDLGMSFMHQGAQLKLHDLPRGAQFSQVTLSQLWRATQAHSVALMFQFTIEHSDVMSKVNFSEFPAISDKIGIKTITSTTDSL